MKKCHVCRYIEKGIFPFIYSKGSKVWDDLPKGSYIDTEGCTEEDHSQIYYCPNCGRKL